ncbi:MBL fold metallo-hydrolase [Pectinatus haikarae]|uniref:Phosphoribosyl 1,2-cyclic phosphodiesterase n=1 Tax=Pectinatus haikarae TaxID=349096 RepID=A0ABT9Y8F1_9FIRM|nr:MBL fold metallo-hydrolase [Pectinatus haikarae]MDQ0204092.1 phosphoribosyl 1,2-cyclic phosphodiesterase [Pectinatus haikarae]
MEIKVLGSSSKGNAYLVTGGRTSLLLDAGLPYNELQKKSNFKLSGIDGCLITHEHGDHSKAVSKLLGHGIACYMSDGTAEILHVNTNPFCYQVEPNKTFEVGRAKIKAFKTIHDAAEPVGFYISLNQDKLLYMTDTAYSKFTFKGLTHILVECNYVGDIIDKNVMQGVIPAKLRKRIQETHFSLDNVKDFLKANDLSKVKEIWLCHLSDANSDAERFKGEIQQISGRPVYIAG